MKQPEQHPKKRNKTNKFNVLANKTGLTVFDDFLYSISVSLPDRHRAFERARI
ncbi:hypothetical protein [Undibacterium sp. Xuan67W]|uniref:hypothetical protein n=1 Tax=Undibacterium sp. Xuan67W TaxID=3413057 RepID=UPI003BF4795E